MLFFLICCPPSTRFTILFHCKQTILASFEDVYSLLQAADEYVKMYKMLLCML